MEICNIENESMYQRTIMMDLAQRRWLKDKLSCVSESLWRGPMPPSKTDTPVSTIQTGVPKPDLLIAFRRDEVVDSDQAKCRALCTWEPYISPERAGTVIPRAFPFFFIEAKKPSTSEAALHQCLNDANFALHNIWSVLEATGNDSSIMDNVRVFTVAAHSKGVLIRMHRMEKPKYENAYLNDTYRWSFEYVELLKLDGWYDKERVCRMIRNILYHYGIDILLKKLKGAIKDIIDKGSKVPKPRRASKAGGAPSASNHAAFSVEHNPGQTPIAGADGATQPSSQVSESDVEANAAQGTPKGKAARKRSAAADPLASFESRGSKTSKLGHDLSEVQI